MLVPAPPLARLVWLPGGATLETVSTLARPPGAAFPPEDDPTDEVSPYERLLRRHGPSAEPEVTIEEEIEREGVEDRDPFELFEAVPERELTDPGLLPEEEDLPGLADGALVPLDEPHKR